MFIIGSPTFAIYMNAVALLFSGIVTLFMPDLEKNRVADSSLERFSISVLKKDWNTVWHFSRGSLYVMVIYFLFSCAMVMTAAIDSLEAAFSKEVLSLTDGEYGFLVSIAGAGIVVGAIINATFVKRLATSILIGGGSLFVSVGYIIYALSHDFLGAAVGFFLLSFSLAFANTGFYTFYQTNIPVNMMGRVGSIYGLIEAVLVIVSTVIFGIVAQMVSIQFVVIIGAIIMFFITVVLFISNLIPSKSGFYSAN